MTRKTGIRHERKRTHGWLSPPRGAPVSPSLMARAVTEKVREETAGRVSLVKDWRSILVGVVVCEKELWGEDVGKKYVWTGR